jgi:hypothetical protein
MQPDLRLVQQFLERLDVSGRHNLCAETPNQYGMNGETYDGAQYQSAFRFIKKATAMGRNVYVSINEPCSILEQVSSSIDRDLFRAGRNGKCSAHDIIALRALVIDIDMQPEACPNAEVRQTNKEIIKYFITTKLNIKPDLIVSSGGGYQIWYILNKKLNVKLFRHKYLSEQELATNAERLELCSLVSTTAKNLEQHLRMISKQFGYDEICKIDAMHNTDRVMRLPGTINYPKKEKVELFQTVVQATIEIDYGTTTNIFDLISKVPRYVENKEKRDEVYVKKDVAPDPNWSGNARAIWCCNIIRDNGMADAHDDIVSGVLFPLIAATKDEDEYSRVDKQTALNCYLEAVSGGRRYGQAGRSRSDWIKKWHTETKYYHPSNNVGRLVNFTKNKYFEMHGKELVTPWSAEGYREERIKVYGNYTKSHLNDVRDFEKFMKGE